MTKIKKIKIILAACCLSFTAGPALAAEIFIDVESREVRVNTEFQASIFLNTGQESINAIEGVLRFPTELLELRRINDGNSIINLWIERPSFDGGQIVFSGITPGGFLGEQGPIFNVTFLAKKDGVGKIEMGEMKVLKNDGQGTAADVLALPLDISITKEAAFRPVKEERDEDPPELFEPEIARDPTILGGKWFLVFATQDKGSGIAHYEVRETRQRVLVFSRWVEAVSPYVLQDQEFRSHVFVRAVDQSGNERIVKIAPRNPLEWYTNYENWIMIIVGLFIAVFMAKKLWKRPVLNS